MGYRRKVSEKYSDEVRDGCHLTGKDRGPAQNKIYINVTQKQIISIPVVFNNLSNSYCHLIFGIVVDKKNDKENFRSFLRQTKKTYQKHKVL